MRKRMLVALFGMLLIPLIVSSGCSRVGSDPAYAGAAAAPEATSTASVAPSATPEPANPSATRAAEGAESGPTPTAAPLPAPTLAAGGRVAHDICYDAESQEADQHLTSLDIYAPTGALDLPVVLYIHGGGWASGDHEYTDAKAAYFPEHGFILVSVNYRLCPSVRPADQAGDIADAVAWVRSHIAEYGGDGSRLFLLGHSAGAHLAGLVATDETYLRRVGLDLDALRGVILLDGSAYDVEQLMCSPDGQSELFWEPFGREPAAWPALSPLAQVAAGKGIAPHLLLLATATGPRRLGAEGLAAALRAAGVYAQVADASAFKDHMTIDIELGLAGDAPTAAVQAFLDMLLAGGPAGLGDQVILQPGP